MATVHLLHGLPGTGKTVLARKLEREHRAVLLNHDEAMVARHGVNPPAAEFARYAAEISEVLWMRAGQVIAQGQDVILDWGFWTRASRDEARERVRAMEAGHVLYRLNCTNAVARERTLQRSQSGDGRTLLINGPAWDGFLARFESLGADEAHVEIETG